MIRVLDLKSVSDDGQWIVSTVALAEPAARIIDTFLNPERLSDTFETMVFRVGPDGKPSSFRDHYRCGYTEITEARIGHELAVHEINSGSLELYGI